MSSTAYPGDDLITDPLIKLTYTIEVAAAPADIWPWLVQFGYHRGGWYIDTWWDRFAQTYVWPRLVPKKARGTYEPAAEAILPHFQGLQVGDIIPDGPPGTAFYDVVSLEENRFLLLHSTSHFKYMAPAFLAGTRLEPYGAFSWAFVLEEIQGGRTRLISRWRGKAGPALLMLPWLPVVRIADHFHQKEILKGVKRRAERGTNRSNTEVTGRSIGGQEPDDAILQNLRPEPVKPTYRFSQRVDNYIKYRPRYPEAVLDLLRAECLLQKTHIIADIGSGTGILSELFLKNGNPVIGVEPDPQMRAGGEYYLRDYPAFTSVAAAAEATTLPDHSVDFVTAGQAFHWFDLRLSRREFGRILRPGGWVVLVWNIQRTAGTPFLEALQSFWQDQRFVKFADAAASERMARVQALRLSRERASQALLEPLFGPGQFRERIFENPLIVDLQGLQGRVLSNGPALEPGDRHYEPMLAAIEALFQKHQRNGTVTIEHDTWVAIGQLPVSRTR